MLVKELKPSYYAFGNKGAVWSDKVHIATGGNPQTLCGTPMLSSNWARIEEHPTIGCEECLKKYLELTS